MPTTEAENDLRFKRAEARKNLRDANRRAIECAAKGDALGKNVALKKAKLNRARMEAYGVLIDKQKSQ